METGDKEKIEKIIGDRKEAHNNLLRRGSRVYRGFLEMEKHAYADGALKKKYKELIAIGISIVINCESCLEWHTREALENGASEAEIIEAIEVGIEMGGGPATVTARFALKVLDYYGKKNKSQSI